jgi:hypothetical protein
MHKLFEEILEMKNDKEHKSTLRIQSILEGNPDLFIKQFDAQLYKQFLEGFTALGSCRPAEYRTDAYRNEYTKQFESLAYYLNRVLS